MCPSYQHSRITNSNDSFALLTKHEATRAHTHMSIIAIG